MIGSMLVLLCLMQPPWVPGPPDHALCVPPTAGETGVIYDIYIPYTSNGMICGCAYDAYNCEDFETWEAAQTCFNFCAAQTPNTWEGLDVHNLDPDKDGFACRTR